MEISDNPDVQICALSARHPNVTKHAFQFKSLQKISLFGFGRFVKHLACSFSFDYKIVHFDAFPKRAVLKAGSCSQTLFSCFKCRKLNLFWVMRQPLVHKTFIRWTILANNLHTRGGRLKSFVSQSDFVQSKSSHFGNFHFRVETRKKKLVTAFTKTIKSTLSEFWCKTPPKSCPL